MPTAIGPARRRSPPRSHCRGEEILRDFDMDAGAVAGLAVGIDRAAMPDRLQRIDAGLHHVAALLAVERRDRPTPQASCSCAGL